MRKRSPAKTVISVIAIVVVALVMLTAQLSYELTDQGVLVKYRYFALMPYSQRLIAYDTIQSTDVLPQLPAMRKIMGVEVFGRLFVGRFRSDAIGEFQAYVGNARIPQVLIKTNEKNYLISPDEAAAFADQLRDRIKR